MFNENIMDAKSEHFQSIKFFLIRSNNNFKLFVQITFSDDFETNFKKVVIRDDTHLNWGRLVKETRPHTKWCCFLIGCEGNTAYFDLNNGNTICSAMVLVFRSSCKNTLIMFVQWNWFSCEYLIKYDDI